MPGSTEIKLHRIESLDEAFEMKRWLGERRPGQWVAVDTESTGLDWWRDDLRTVQFGDRHDGWCIEWDQWAGLVHELIGMYQGPVGYWNIKHDVHFLEHNGVNVNRARSYDGRAMAHLQNPWRPTALKKTAVRILGPWADFGQQQLKESMMRGGWDYRTVPIEAMWEYAAFDTCITAQCIEELWPGIQQSYSEIYDLELASTMVLCDMERRGLMTDREWMVKHSDQWQENADKCAVALRNFYIGNPASDRQVIQALQDTIGWTPIVFTEKGNISLDKDVLAGISHPIADLVLEYRTNEKFQKYVQQHLELAGPDGRLHCSVNPLGARTGRMSVSRPSMQNLPTGDDRIRGGFVAEEEQVIISADYDQIEGRIFAHYSGDKNMIESIRYGDYMTSLGYDGYDLHSMAARIVFGIGSDQAVPKKLRSQTKTVQFGKIYGSGIERFAANSGLTLDEARNVVGVYEEQFPETRKIGGFQGRVTERLYQREKSDGEAFVLTAYGRKEPCWPSQAYKAVNYLIQGTAADVLKDRIVALSKTWVGQHMRLPVHDEILFSVPETAMVDAIQTIRQVMPERERFVVPLTVDVEAVRRWGGEPLALMAA